MKAKYYYKSDNTPEVNSPVSIGVVSILYYKDKILFEERTDTENWAFIGGKLEINESIIDGIRREVFEETNLKVDDFNFFGIFSDPGRIIEYDNGEIKRIITIVFKAKIETINDLKCSNESKSLRFFNINEMPDNLLVRTHLPILESLKKNEQIVIE
jgi:ADP-ribose pyrophosphatase YjhB (NUDIX family)